MVQRRIILMADDDPEDQELTWEALQAATVDCEFHTVADGQELLEYLHHEGRFQGPDVAPVPDLIFLDLNMPRVAGLEALQRIKTGTETEIARIPVLVLSTSSTPESIDLAYSAGAQSYIVKPSSFGQYVETMKLASDYWNEVSMIPER